jgi:hypothetical protein
MLLRLFHVETSRYTWFSHVPLEIFLSYFHFRIKFAIQFYNYLTLKDSSYNIRVIGLRNSHAKYVRVTGDKIYLKEMQHVSEKFNKPRL